MIHRKLLRERKGTVIHFSLREWTVAEGGQNTFKQGFESTMHYAEYLAYGCGLFSSLNKIF